MRILVPLLFGFLIGNLILLICIRNESRLGEIKPKRIIFKLDRVYEICSPKEEDPYRKQGRHNVMISDTSGYYVQYFEVGKKEGLHFSRSCSEFQELITNCR